MTPKKERKYFDFVNRLGLQRANAAKDDDPHTKEMSFCLLHMVMGMVTESGEIADLLKKHMAYARPLDVTKLKDELGDLFFYLCGALIELGSSLDEIVDMNMAKLKARYPNGYEHQAANNRSPATENEAQRQVINEGGVKKRGVKCTVCSGDGYLVDRVYKYKCPQCNGIGYVEKKPINSANNQDKTTEDGAQKQAVKTVVNVDGRYVQKGSAEDDRLGPYGTKTGTGARL